LLCIPSPQNIAAKLLKIVLSRKRLPILELLRLLYLTIGFKSFLVRLSLLFSTLDRRFVKWANAVRARDASRGQDESRIDARIGNVPGGGTILFRQ
jgi:hypothetical protein